MYKNICTFACVLLCTVLLFVLLCVVFVFSDSLIIRYYFAFVLGIFVYDVFGFVIVFCHLGFFPSSLYSVIFGVVLCCVAMFCSVCFDSVMFCYVLY